MKSHPLLLLLLPNKTPDTAACHILKRPPNLSIKRMLILCRFCTRAYMFLSLTRVLYRLSIGVRVYKSEPCEWKCETGAAGVSKQQEEDLRV